MIKPKNWLNQLICYKTIHIFGRQGWVIPSLVSFIKTDQWNCVNNDPALEYYFQW